MKIPLLIFSFLILHATSYSQQNPDPHQLDYEDYMTKHKNQRAAGRVFLFGGIAMLGIGTLIITGKGALAAENSDAILPAAGLVSSICSIPFFISAGKNKRRAAALAFGNIPLHLPKSTASFLNTPPAPTLTLKVRL